MATRFKFANAFDFEIRSPKGALQSVKAYKAGTIDMIPEAHAEAAEAAGAGERATEAETGERASGAAAEGKARGRSR